jgi:hypothetical protein
MKSSTSKMHFLGSAVSGEPVWEAAPNSKGGPAGASKTAQPTPLSATNLTSLPAINLGSFFAENLESFIQLKQNLTSQPTS